MADHRHELFPDEMFEDLFPSKPRSPSIPADTVASVMVLQALEGLSDRDAARALTDRISWKVACGSPSTMRASTTRSSPTGARDCASPTAPSESSRRCARSSTPPGSSGARPAGHSTRRCSTTPSPPRTPSPNWWPRSAGCAGSSPEPRVSPSCPRLRRSGQAPHRLGRRSGPGRTRGRVGQRRPDGARHVRDVAETRAADGDRTVGAGRWPGRRAQTTTASGGSCAASRRTASSRSSTPRPATCTSPVPIPRRLQGPPGHRARDRTHHRGGADPGQRPRRADRCRAARRRRPGLQVLADGAYGSGETLAALEGARHSLAIKPLPTHVAIQEAFTATTSSSTKRPAP